MNTIKNEFISPEEFEVLQDKYECKAEYCNGEIILHSDISTYHNSIVTNISAELVHFLRGSNCKSYTEQIEVIFDEYHKFKPDVFVVCDEATKKGESFTSPPKIIFEVISKSTALHDRFTKMNIYQKYGVQEYNIVEQTGHIVQYGLIDGYYQITNTFHSGDCYKSIVFTDFSIDLKYIY